MKIQRVLFSLLFMFACIVSIVAMCPDGQSQGREKELWDPLTGQIHNICPHQDGLYWCCYDPCIQQ